MATILDLPEVRERISRLSVEDYHRLGEYNENGRRTELIRGILIEKMSKSPLHSAVAKALYDLLSERLKGQELVVRREDPLTLVDSEPEPDVSVVKGSKSDFFREHPKTAELVIEVAVSSAALDRANASLYAEAGVKEYWIVLANTREVELYRDPQGAEYRQRVLIPAGEMIECRTLPGVVIRPSDIFS